VEFTQKVERRRTNLGRGRLRPNLPEVSWARGLSKTEERQIEGEKDECPPRKAKGGIWVRRVGKDFRGLFWGTWKGKHITLDGRFFSRVPFFPPNDHAKSKSESSYLP